MNLKQIQFIKHCDRVEDFPSTQKEIAIVGRSNVGKSSLINHLCQKNIAKISKKPGKTKSIHFFRLEPHYTLADLPGYGFAKVTKKLQSSWSELMEAYFSQRKELICVLILIDCMARITPFDEQMMRFLEQNELPYVIVVTKVDKLNQKQMHELKTALAKQVFANTFFVSVKRPAIALQTYIHGLFK